MKKIIAIIGIIILSLIIVLNLIFTTELGLVEKDISVKFNSVFYLLFLVIAVFFIFWITKKFDDIKNVKLKKVLCITGICLFIIFNIVWLILVNPPIIGDTGHVCDIAELFFSNDTAILARDSYANGTMAEYMQGYHQQISLAFIFSIMFRIFGSAERVLLRILNFFGNILIIFSLYKISRLINKKYQTNQTLLFVLILTFFTLLMVSTFVYGDLLSIRNELIVSIFYNEIY